MTWLWRIGDGSGRELCPTTKKPEYPCREDKGRKHSENRLTTPPPSLCLDGSHEGDDYCLEEREVSYIADQHNDKPDNNWGSSGFAPIENLSSEFYKV